VVGRAYEFSRTHDQNSPRDSGGYSKSNRGSNERFEAIETALRDMAEQLVLLARGVKTETEVLEC
jgi:hypothetical protein